MGNGQFELRDGRFLRGETRWLEISLMQNQFPSERLWSPRHRRAFFLGCPFFWPVLRCLYFGEARRCAQIVEFNDYVLRVTLDDEDGHDCLSRFSLRSSSTLTFFESRFRAQQWYHRIILIRKIVENVFFTQKKHLPVCSKCNCLSTKENINQLENRRNFSETRSVACSALSLHVSCCPCRSFFFAFLIFYYMVLVPDSHSY